MSLAHLKAEFARLGCRSLYAKPLAPNDCSKSQVYFGPGFAALNLFPVDEITPDGDPGNATFKAPVRLSWLTTEGDLVKAPHAKLILYPQYPEVRFSGFLKGCRRAPSDLMSSRLSGRILFLGVRPDGGLIGFVAGPESAEARELGIDSGRVDRGLFISLVLPGQSDEERSRSNLIRALKRTAEKGWIPSRQIDQDGNERPCTAPQCGGFTLEAELGVAKNSSAEPDFEGWEVKQHAVSSFDRPASGSPITLMTPEPTGGFYKQHGPEAFVREFGYLDRHERPDRMNFGGVHKVGVEHPRTGLVLVLQGYDAEKGAVVDAAGAAALVDANGRVAASWAFSGLLAHWSRKHRKAVYVPSMRRIKPAWEYSFGHKVRLAEQTDGLYLLRAFSKGVVYYDPAIKVESASANPRTKRRSQFRVSSKDIPDLYGTVSIVDVLLGG